MSSILIRNMIFTLLITATFIPVLNIIDDVLRLHTTLSRRVLASVIMASLFLLVSEKIPLTMERMGFQLLGYFIIIHFVLRLSSLNALKTLVIYVIITVCGEYAIMGLLNNALIDFKQLMMIDTFYGLTITLYATIMFAIASMMHIWMKRREYSQFVSKEDNE